MDRVISFIPIGSMCFNLVVLGLDSFPIFFSLVMMYVRYLMTICEMDSIDLLILYWGILISMTCSIIDVWRCLLYWL